LPAKEEKATEVACTRTHACTHAHSRRLQRLVPSPVEVCTSVVVDSSTYAHVSACTPGAVCSPKYARPEQGEKAACLYAVLSPREWSHPRREVNLRPSTGFLDSCGPRARGRCASNLALP
jgi:hypothetical protein